MIWFENFYAEELVIDGKVISNNQKIWNTKNLEDYHKNREQWEELAKEKDTYDFVRETFCIGLFVETEQDGHTIVFRRGHSFSIKSDD